MGHLWSGFNSYSIIDGFAESLFAPKIFLGGLDRNVAEQELNLLQFTA
jgi:hypothetical protein